jgi:hypothetical protein
VHSRRELVQIVRQLLGERAVFLVTYRGKEWADTTLIRRNAKPKLRGGESARIVSWSGRFDRAIDTKNLKILKS